MKNFNLFISHFFRIVLLFFLAFIWIRFYQNNLLLTILYSAIVCLVLDIAISLVSQKRLEETSLEVDEMKKAQGYANYFAFNNKSVVLNFFHSLINKLFEAQKKSNFLWWKNGNDVVVLYPYYNVDSIKIRDLFTIYNNIKLPQKPSKIIVCGLSFANETYEFSQGIPINFVLLDQFNVYEKLMKPNNFYPKETLELRKSKKSTWRSFCSYALNKRRAKAWLFSSLILIFSSFFVKVSIYYLIVSSILLILAIISFTNTKYNKPIVDNIL